MVRFNLYEVNWMFVIIKHKIIKLCRHSCKFHRNASTPIYKQSYDRRYAFCWKAQGLHPTADRSKNRYVCAHQSNISGSWTGGDHVAFDGHCCHTSVSAKVFGDIQCDIWYDELLKEQGLKTRIVGVKCVLFLWRVDVLGTNRRIPSF